MTVPNGSPARSIQADARPLRSTGRRRAGRVQGNEVVELPYADVGELLRLQPVARAALPRFATFPRSPIGPRDPIYLPDESHEVDHEADPALMIGA